MLSGAVGLFMGSCAYDPYYSSGSSYSYGQGYGYGGSSFSTSYFVSTGNSRWGYDPHVRCYYDYTRRAYYDPYLYGYYPVGYRPIYVSGTPHPHGWRQGSSRISPPSRIHSHNLSNYHSRGNNYRNLGTDWSRNVRVTTQQPSRQGGYDRDSGSQWRGGDQRGTNSGGSMWNRNGSQQPPTYDRRGNDGRQQWQGSGDRGNSGGYEQPRNVTPNPSPRITPEGQERLREFERIARERSNGIDRSGGRARGGSGSSNGGSYVPQPQPTPPANNGGGGFRDRDRSGGGSDRGNGRGGVRGLGEG